MPPSAVLKEKPEQNWIKYLRSENWQHKWWTSKGTDYSENFITEDWIHTLGFVVPPPPHTHTGYSGMLRMQKRCSPTVLWPTSWNCQWDVQMAEWFCFYICVIRWLLSGESGPPQAMVCRFRCNWITCFPKWWFGSHLRSSVFRFWFGSCLQKVACWMMSVPEMLFPPV